MDRLISIQQISQEKIARKRAWIWNSIATGDFPPPVVRSGKALWRESDVDKWIENFVARNVGAAEGATKFSRTASANKARVTKLIQKMLEVPS